MKGPQVIRFKRLSLGAECTADMEEIADLESTSLVGGDENFTCQSGPSYQVTLLICIGAFGCGYGIGFTSPAAHQLERSNSSLHLPGGGHQLQLNEEEISWFGSILFLACMLGGVIGGPLAERLSRKGALIVSNLPLVAGWLAIAFANDLPTMLAGRTLVGLNVGMGILLNPVYVTETVLPELRGRLTTFLQLSIAAGILVCFAMGDDVHYMYMAHAGAGLGAVYALMLFWIPKSPRWCVRHEQNEKSIRALQRLRGQHANILMEHSEITCAVQLELKAAKFAWSDMLRPALRRPFLMSVALMLFQQWCGINVVMSYTAMIFDGAGLASISSLLSIGVAAIQLLFTFLSVFVVDRYGRRPLLMAAGLGLTVSCVLMALFFYRFRFAGGAAATILPVVALYAYTAAFSLGLGVLPWLFMAEAFPSRAMPFMSPISAALCWFNAFIITKYFHAMTQAFGDGGAFVLFAAVSFLLVLFSKFTLIETKGLTLEQVEAKFKPQSYSSSSNVTLPEFA